MEALIVRKTPVKDIEFDRLHAVQIGLKGRDGYKTMSRVDQKSAPKEAWLVVNRNHRNAEAFRGDSYQLEEGLEPAKHPDRIRRCQLNIGG